MAEKHLQHELVLRFGIKYPEYRDLLFEVNNDARTARKSMGLREGASDMVFIAPPSGQFIGIELKSKGTRHKAGHINRQLAWGQSITKAGGLYLMTYDIDGVMDFLSSKIEGTHSVFPFANKLYLENQIYPQIKEGKKTVLFL